MKNFLKEQIAVFAVSFLAIVILALQIVSIDADTTKADAGERYRSSIDSVRNATRLFEFISGGEFSEPRDVFNFKITELKPLVKQVEEQAPVIRTRWINTNEIELFGRDVISYSFFFNGRARFTINGRTQEFAVGDELKVGKIIQREVVQGTGSPTGRTRTGNDFSGKILLINERSVYVDTNMPDNVVQYRPGVEARLFARNLMQDISSDGDSGTQQDAPAGGRRPGRGR